MFQRRYRRPLLGPVRWRLLCYAGQRLLVLGSPGKDIPATDSRLRASSHLEKGFQAASTPQEFLPGKAFVVVLVCLF